MHTQGPWHIGMKPGPIVYGPDGEQVCDLTADMLPKDEITANARLIAAAPELLAALMQLASISPSSDYNEFRDAKIVARQAIAKATGK